MKQFYESYRGDSIVSALRSQLSWTHHRIILGQSKWPEERGLAHAREIDWRMKTQQFLKFCNMVIHG
jgi:hypothetical protein